MLILGKNSAIELHFSEFIKGLTVLDLMFEIIVFDNIFLPILKDVIVLYVLKEIAFDLLRLRHLCEANLVEYLHKHVHVVGSNVFPAHVIYYRIAIGETVDALFNRVNELFVVFLFLF